MQVDTEFLPDEPLYLRINPQYFLGAQANLDQITINHVRFPSFSVNRGKYSAPEDVIKPKPEWGIASFLVRHVPQKLSNDLSCDLKIAHCPEEGNYAHSEVRAYKDGVPGYKPNRAARLEFRAILRNHMVILRLPMPWES